MDERSALALLADHLDRVGDDAAVIGDLVLTIDMLHESTDLPAGTTHYTAGWRAVAASLSDAAAMGADPIAAVAAYGVPAFDRESLLAFVDGARDVCTSVDTEYVGGDLDEHAELTTATAVVGRTDDPVPRSGAQPGDVVCVTGTLGRTAGAIKLFDADAIERANELFRFEPRIATGKALAPVATAMLDSSDGLARSLHQLADASDVAIAVESPLPFDEILRETTGDESERRELGLFFGEDFELVCTIGHDELQAVREETPVPLTPIGRVANGAGVTLDGSALPDRGYTHGEPA